MDDYRDETDLKVRSKNKIYVAVAQRRNDDL